jgi:glycosyltransferase involved in cell wall biosynthesis
MKTVTVIIPTYNRENIIGRTLASILDQDYRKVDILVVDDGSMDATEEVIRRVAERNDDVIVEAPVRCEYIKKTRWVNSKCLNQR